MNNTKNFLFGNGLYLMTVDNKFISLEEKIINNNIRNKFLKLIADKAIVNKIIERNLDFFPIYLKNKLFNENKDIFLNIFENKTEEIKNIMKNNKENIEVSIWKLFKFFSVKVIKNLLIISDFNEEINYEKIFEFIYEKIVLLDEVNNFYDLKIRISKYSNWYITILNYLFMTKIIISDLYRWTILKYCFYDKNKKQWIWKYNKIDQAKKLQVENKISEILKNNKYRNIYTTNYTNLTTNAEDNKKIIYLHGNFNDGYTNILFGKKNLDKYFLEKFIRIIKMINKMRNYENNLGESFDNIDLYIKNSFKTSLNKTLKNIYHSNEFTIFGLSIFGDEFLIDRFIFDNTNIKIYTHSNEDYYKWSQFKNYYERKYSKNKITLKDSLKFFEKQNIIKGKIDIDKNKELVS